jgi:beta-glucosidase
MEDIWKRHPITDSPEDAALVIDADERNWKFYCDPILADRYSDYIIEHLSSEGTLMEMKPRDFELTSQPLDFFGLNVYNRVMVTKNQQAKADFSQGGNFLNNRTEYYPDALYDAVKLLHDLYDIKVPIYVTENGTYTIGNETVGESGMVEDSDRVRYVQGFLQSLEKALKAGYDVRGYYRGRLWIA